MERSEGIRFLQDVRRRVENKTATTPNVQGLVGWMLSMLDSWRGAGEACQRQLRLIETLPLGGKKELMLVTCAGESFLVGGGAEGVETIVRLHGEASLDRLAASLDKTW
jgi:flagellar biogenesis protein FliO